QSFGADLLVKIMALPVCTHIAPDYGGTHDLVRAVHQKPAKPLPSETYTKNLFWFQEVFGQKFAHGHSRCAPPIFRTLLGPADLWRSKGLVLFSCRRKHVPQFIHDYGACSACTHIYAKNVHWPILSRICR